MSNLQLAGCIIRDTTGKILLIHRNTAKRVQWEIPGGVVEPGEDTATTAAREIKEELDLTISLGPKLGEEAFGEDGDTLAYSWYAATVTTGTPHVLEPEEHDDFGYFSLEEMTALGNELSANGQNFLAALKAKRVTL